MKFLMIPATLFVVASQAFAAPVQAAPLQYVQSRDGNPVTNFQAQCWQAKSEAKVQGYNIDCTGKPVASTTVQPKAAAKTNTVVLKSNFEFNEATIPAASRQELKRVARQLKARKNDKIVVRGYADRLGTVDYNQKLSTARAQAAKDILVREGVAADRVATEGRGVAESKSKNCQNANMKQLINCLEVDRRVEVEVPATSVSF